MTKRIHVDAKKLQSTFAKKRPKINISMAKLATSPN
jgi:hypothetical protein